MTEIPAWAAALTAPGLLAITVLLVLTGRLLWHRIAERMLADKTQEAQQWREAFQAQQEINRAHAEAQQDVTAALDTITALIRALPSDAERSGR